MRPVRFVALSEDGQAFVLADEVGRLLALPIDDRVQGALRSDRHGGEGSAPHSATSTASLSPRDIQARIRSGESAEDVARVAGVPVDRVLRYAGPVLQERAMLAQHARRTKLRSSDKGASLAEVVDSRLAQHGIEAEKISWDAYRREDGTWRITATWPSGKATAQALWELDKARQLVTPHDDMAQYLCTERPAQILGQDPPLERPQRGDSSRGELGSGRDGGGGDRGRGGDQGRGTDGRGTHGGHEPMRPPAEPPRRENRLGRGLAADPIRAGRDALLASLDRPLGSGGRDQSGTPGRDQAGTPGRDHGTPGRDASGRVPATPAAPAASVEATAPHRPETQRQDGTAPHRPARGAAALIGKPAGSAFEDDRDAPQDMPAVPSLAVLRPRRTAQGVDENEKPRKRLPSWDDVLFGGAPAARETS